MRFVTFMTTATRQEAKIIKSYRIVPQVTKILQNFWYYEQKAFSKNKSHNMDVRLTHEVVHPDSCVDVKTDIY